MKKFLLATAAVAALGFSASAFTVEEICGEYNATGINLSQNELVLGKGTVAGLESVDWTMTISVKEDNTVTLTQFLKNKVNGDTYPEYDFNLEGEFNPETNTITIQPTYVQYPRQDFPSVAVKAYIAKYDGRELKTINNGQEFEAFTATFDENKNLTVSPWAVYINGSAKLELIPTYGADNTVGTYFTSKSSGDSGSSFAVEEICGSYNAKGINLSQNELVLGKGTVAGLESVDWTMTISVKEGNTVTLTQFLKNKVNGGTYPEYDFNLEGEFNPETNTITIQPTYVQYPRQDFPSVAVKAYIAKYDGRELKTINNGQEFEAFTATFDKDKNLTVSPWAVYINGSAKLELIPTYGADNTVGTYFTRETSGIEDVTVESEAPVEYYNLQGVRVAEPAPGLYIRRQGNKVTKVVIR